MLSCWTYSRLLIFTYHIYFALVLAFQDFRCTSNSLNNPVQHPRQGVQHCQLLLNSVFKKNSQCTARLTTWIIDINTWIWRSTPRAEQHSSNMIYEKNTTYNTNYNLLVGWTNRLIGQSSSLSNNWVLLPDLCANPPMSNQLCHWTKDCNWLNMIEVWTKKNWMICIVLCGCNTNQPKNGW